MHISELVGADEWHTVEGRPYVVYKYAATLDGRIAAPAGRQPWRVVVDTHARTPRSARVLDDAAPTLIAVADGADASHLEGRATVVRLPKAAEGLDITSLLRALHERDVRGVFLEGGPTLAASFVSAGLADRVIAYIAPALLAGARAPSRAERSARSATRCAAT
ncbi:RibD family protein [Streptomyces mobaraensis]|uniref:RibD family protein n=1 Tax=Streptomyces mobaraensis TaxID=35621 RepID=UPI0033F45F9C